MDISNKLRPRAIIHPIASGERLSTYRVVVLLGFQLFSITHKLAQLPKMSSANRRERFLSIFPQIVEELTAYLKKEGMPKDAVEWYERVSMDGAGPDT